MFCFRTVEAGVKSVDLEPLNSDEKDLTNAIKVRVEKFCNSRYSSLIEALKRQTQNWGTGCRQNAIVYQYSKHNSSGFGLNLTSLSFQFCFFMLAERHTQSCDLLLLPWPTVYAECQYSNYEGYINKNYRYRTKPLVVSCEDRRPNRCLKLFKTIKIFLFITWYFFF